MTPKPLPDVNQRTFTNHNNRGKNNTFRKYNHEDRS